MSFYGFLCCSNGFQFVCAIGYSMKRNEITNQGSFFVIGSVCTFSQFTMVSVLGNDCLIGRLSSSFIQRRPRSNSSASVLHPLPLTVPH